MKGNNPAVARGAANTVRLASLWNTAATQALSALLHAGQCRGPRTPPRITTNVRKKIAEATEDAPILFQVARQVVFHPDKPAFLPPSQLVG